MTDSTLYRVAALAVLVLSGWLLLSLLLGTVLSILMPFLCALALACLLRPCARFLERRVRVSARIVHPLLLFLLLCAVCFGTVRLCTLLFEEASALLLTLARHPDVLKERLLSLCDTLPDALAERLREGGLFSVLEGLSLRLLGTLVSLLGNLLAALPSTVLSFAVFLVAAFYFVCDGTRMANVVRGWRGGSTLLSMLYALQRTFFSYVRAYLLLALLMFIFAFCGLFVIGVRYACLAALLCTLVDLLPVLGVGTVLVPWGLLTLAGGDARIGFSLLILYAVLFAVRQIAEPRLVGAHTGLHPLFTLFLMYAGYRLFGVAVMLTAPLLAAFARTLYAVLWRKGRREGRDKVEN